MLRLNPEAHPLSFVNDNNIGTSWVSRVFADNSQLDQGVTISIDLENGQYQVICNSRMCISFLWLLQLIATNGTALNNRNGFSHSPEDQKYYEIKVLTGSHLL